MGKRVMNKKEVIKEYLEDRLVFAQVHSISYVGQLVQDKPEIAVMHHLLSELESGMYVKMVDLQGKKMMNVEKCIHQIVQAQKTLDVVAYAYSGSDETYITEIKLGIAQAERYLKDAKALIGDTE